MSYESVDIAPGAEPNRSRSSSRESKPTHDTAESGSFEFGSDTDEYEMIKLDYVEEPGGFCHRSSQSPKCLECDMVIRDGGPPKAQFRPKYSIISDFAKQHWCEMQLLYSLAPDIILLRAIPGEEVNIEESETAKVVKSKGTDIHQKRELELQVSVKVVVETKEDKWALRLINLQQTVLAFCNGQRLVREVPVFGCPFGQDIFIFGIIDELRYNPDKHIVEISELKTRRFYNPPNKAQQDKDKYQVSLYAHVFNELVLGSVSKETIVSHLGLNVDTKLSSDVMKHVQGVGNGDVKEGCTFGDLLETALSQVQTLCCISHSRVEYIHQDDNSEILVLDFHLDTDLLRHIFKEQCRWWRGERGTKGVDIEDCWKCHHCQFSSLCEWRGYMANKMARGRKK